MEYYITKDIDELQDMIDDARRDGRSDIDLEFDPWRFNLVDEDDHPALEDIDTEDLRAELSERERQEIEEVKCSITDIAQKVIEKSPAAAREFFTDILGLTHLANSYTICRTITEKIGEKKLTYNAIVDVHYKNAEEFSKKVSKIIQWLIKQDETFYMKSDKTLCVQFNTAEDVELFNGEFRKLEIYLI